MYGPVNFMNNFEMKTATFFVNTKTVSNTMPCVLVNIVHQFVMEYLAFGHRLFSIAEPTSPTCWTLGYTEQ